MEKQSELGFTSHNIVLDKGIETIPGTPLLIDTEKWKAIKKAINRFAPEAKTAIDLGCLEGGYSVALARMGLKTFGVEGRQENYDKCIRVLNALYPEPMVLCFDCDDVRYMETYGTFDITLCAGLLYHMDKPVSLLKSIKKVTKQLLILDTHHAPKIDDRYDNYWLNKITHGKAFKQRSHNYYLSGLQENESYKGRWFNEYPDKSLWASVGNAQSFWLCKDELIRAIKDIGFLEVYEINESEYNSRSLFACI